MSTLAKPQMRGLLASRIKFHLVGATVCSLTSGLLFKLFYCDPRKRAHDEFYRTYDAEKQLKIMEDAGLMQSCPK